MGKNGTNGFTLVELIITITVSVILVSAGAMTIRNFSNNQKVEAVKSELISQIKLARNMAITKQCPGCDKFDYVRVVVDNNNLTLRIVARDSIAGSDKYTFLETKKLDNTDDLAINASFDFGFLVGDGRLTNGSGVLNTGSVDIRLYPIDNAANFRNILIDKSGLINEK